MNRITSLNVVRAGLLFIVFSCHAASWLPEKIVLYSAELTGYSLEMFFVVSGFVCALSLMRKPKIPSTLNYVVRKIKSFYPLHLVTLLLCLALQIYQIKQNGGEIPWSNYTAQAFFNVTLLQSWTGLPEYAFAFNGVSWFLSSIIVCYALTPLTVKAIKKVRVHPLMLLAFVVMARYSYVMGFRHFIDLNAFSFTNIFPLYRFLEYLCGMLVASYWIRNGEKAPRNSAAQLAGLGIFFLSFYMTHVNELIDVIRPLFIVFELALLIAFVDYRGIISDLGATKFFSGFADASLEFFLLHQMMIRYIFTLFGLLHISAVPESGLMRLVHFMGSFFVILLVSVITHTLAKKINRASSPAHTKTNPR